MNGNAIVKGSLTELAQRKDISLAESFLSADAILIVDMSGSMAAQDAPGGMSRYEAAESELKRLQEQNPGRLAVVAFSNGAEFCPTGIPRRMGGTTNLSGALRFVKAADDTGVQFIVISDGQPDDEQKALSVAREFKSKISTVYIGPEDGGSWGGRSFLERLAQESGGTYAESQAPGLLAEQVTQLLEGQCQS